MDNVLSKEGPPAKVSVVTLQSEEKRGAEKFVTDVESTNLGHNFRDYANNRITLSKEIDLAQFDHDSVINGVWPNMETNIDQSGSAHNMDGNSKKI